MSAQPSILGKRLLLYKQVAFGTVVTQLIEPMKGAYTTLFELWMGSSATLQTVTIMRECGRTFFTADAAASQAVVNISADPGKYSTGYLASPPSGNTLLGFANAPRTANNLIAASDFVVYKCADGTYVVDTVASVSSLAITLTTNLPTGGVKAGDPFWFYGITTDTNPYDARAHLLLKPTVSTQTKYGNAQASLSGFLSSFVPNSPIILHLGNITADTNSFDFVSAGYTNRGDFR